MILQILFVLLTPLTVFAQSDCKLAQSDRTSTLLCPTLIIEQSRNYSGQEQMMTVLFDDGMSMTLSIFTDPQGTNTLFELDLADRESSHLTKDDYRQLQMAIDWIRQYGLTDSFMLVGFFANLPSDESLEPLTIASGEVPWPWGGDDSSTPDSKKKR